MQAHRVRALLATILCPAMVFILSACGSSVDELLPPYNASALPAISPENNMFSLWPDGIPATPISGRPKFIDYPSPAPLPTPLPIAAFPDSGCEQIEYGGIKCSVSSPLRALGCDWFGGPSELAAGLTPAYPMVATCVASRRVGKCLYVTGHPEPEWISYIFSREGEYVWANSVSIMQELFAPVDTPQEAITYAQLVTGLEARYSVKRASGSFHTTTGKRVFFQEVLEGSHAVESDTGYVVNLFHSDILGCDAWITTQVDILVQYDGAVVWLGAKPVDAIVQKGMCVGRVEPGSNGGKQRGWRPGGTWPIGN